METANIGSISTGTMRSEDLLDAFAFELEDLVQRNAEAWCSDDGRSQRDRYMSLIGQARECDPDSDDADELVQELFDALGEFAPEYCYFGSHPGDGADYGFWPCEDFQQMMRDDGVMEVSDCADIPEDYRGLVMHVNDHGNATLYSVESDSQARELWSVV